MKYLPLLALNRNEYTKIELKLRRRITRKGLGC